MTSLHDNASNLNVDWFYRGKKKSKKASTGSTTASTGNSVPNQTNNSHNNVTKEKLSTLNTNVSNASLIPSPTLSNDSTVSNKKNELPITNDTTTTNTTKSNHRSLLSHQLNPNRPRSASDSSKAKPVQPTPPPPLQQQQQAAPTPQSTKKPLVSSSIKRSNSLNEQQKPKKSIFSAFSKLKASAKQQPPKQTAPQQNPAQQSINVTPEPISIPSTPKSLPTTPKSLPSSMDSISPTSAFLLGSYHKSSPKSFQPHNQNQDRVILNKNPNRSSLPIQSLANVRLRRVTFALDKLPDDPPQQIPSRRPKKGNVIVVEDLVSGPSKLNIGITNETQVSDVKKYDEKELKLVMESQRRALEESDKHAQEAHFAAKRIAHEVKNFKPLKRNEKQVQDDDDEIDVQIDEQLNVSNLEIDKPIHLHEHHYEEEPHNEFKDIPLELIYTRCCHLREILPIPATLKQLKNKHSPLSTLKMLNPKPTLIDIYSFSDFIAIVPIKNLIFDNVSMTTDMFRILLASLISSKSIEKISLKNVPLDSFAWKYLCKFLSRNQSISKLDISQMKIKQDLPLDQHRSQMDWGLFIDTIHHRKGIQELILNGCKISPSNFIQLIDAGLSMGTKRLGCVNMDLNIEQIKKIANWITDSNSTVEGIDFGYNNLSNDGMLKPLIKRLSNCENKNLSSLSFNNTELTNVEDVALLIRSISKLENLRFLDLSNLNPIFPGIMPYLNKYLPRFPNLQRLHLDSNELSTQSFSILSGIIPKCLHLIHLSIMNQSNISYSAAATLYSAIKSSKTIVNLDIDYDLIDEKISSRIAVCLMRNMERTMHHEDELDHHLDSHDDILFDGSLIAETAGKLLEKFQTNEIDNDEFSKKFLKKKFLNKINESRNNVNKTIDELLTKQEQKLLSLQEKEDLLRFYFLDNSLLKILEIFQNLNDDYSNQQQDVQPHQMVTEVSEGKETPIDVATGKPILLRSVSQTSIQAKKQEEEEGEFHRWGFFVQQQRQMYPNDVQQPAPPAPAPAHPVPAPVAQQQQQQQLPQQPVQVNKQDLSSWAKLPSGEELREAVIKAKGINSISDLIENVNENRFILDKIYPPIKESSRETNLQSHPGSGSINGSLDSDVESTEEYVEAVDEVYDKLLNSLQKVRSNK